MPVQKKFSQCRSGGKAGGVKSGIMVSCAFPFYGDGEEGTFDPPQSFAVFHPQDIVGGGEGKRRDRKKFPFPQKNKRLHSGSRKGKSFLQAAF